MTDVTKYSRHLILGTAGHIDHGKSSLVAALTGTDPDRLSEEKRRGITIELGFAQLDLGEGLTLGVVDVPGHERFVRQMIAGSSGIDIALLCIAADDGIMPQTREHIAVLELLEIPRIVVALTKIDAVDGDWASFVADEIESFLSETPYAASPIVAVSARTGEGLENLKSTLAEVAHEHTALERGKWPRMPIDRVFTIKGSGTVVTGTLWSGSINVEDELEILPSKQKARVRSIQVHGSGQKSAAAGNRVALNLHGVKTNEVRPGDFLSTPGLIEPTDRFDAYFTYNDVTKSGKSLKSGARVHMAHGTREVIGRILFMDGLEALAPGMSSYAQIRLEQKLPFSPRDRFVVRTYSPVHVIGGGLVLACHPRRRTHLTKTEASFLEAVRTDDKSGSIKFALLMQKRPISLNGLATFVSLDRSEVAKHLEDIVGTEGIIQIAEQGKEPLFIQRSFLQKYEGAIEKELLKFHSDNPTEAGIPKDALRQLIDKRLDADAFDAILAETAAAEKAVIHAGLVTHPKAGAGAKQREKQAKEELLTILAQQGQAPSSIAELIHSTSIDQSLLYRALGTLEDQGKVSKVGSDFYFETSALVSLEQAVKTHLEQNGQATVAELKEAMNTSRKYAVPLLEYFDNNGLTIRQGDTRTLRK